MARTGGYCRSPVWRSCGVTLHAALQNKSVVCSGSRVTNSTVMKLHESDNRGGIIVKTYTKSTCSYLYIYTLSQNVCIIINLMCFTPVSENEENVLYTCVIKWKRQLLLTPFYCPCHVVNGQAILYGVDLYEERSYMHALVRRIERKVNEEKSGK